MQKFHEAIRNGRLFALPNGDNKTEALKILADALGNVCGNNALTKEFLIREAECHTGVGYGLAIPHLRIPGKGEIVCAVGWSQTGFDFGATDQEPARLIAAYCVPDERKNEYLREVSGLIRTTFKPASGKKLDSLASIDSPLSAREFLLAWTGLF